MPGASADTGPKHKPRGPRGRLTGSQTTPCTPDCGGVSRSTSQTSRPVGLLAAVCHCVPLSPLGGGQRARGISAGGKSLPGRGSDGDAGGGSAHSHSLGGAGAFGEGVSPLPRMRRTRAAPAGAHGLGQGGQGWASCGGSSMGEAWHWGSWGLSPSRACFTFSSCCTPRTKVQRLPWDGCHARLPEGKQRCCQPGRCCLPLPSPLLLYPARCWHRPHHSAWKQLFARLWDEPSQQQYGAPTAGFMFPVLTMALQPGTRSLQPLARGSGTPGEAGDSGSVAARGLEVPGLPPPDSGQTSAAGRGWLQTGSGGKTAEEGGSCEGQPAQHACHLGWGTPIGRVERYAALRRSFWNPQHPRLSCAASGTAQQGHWVTCPESHGSSVAEMGSINCGSLNCPLFPTSTKADSVPGPKERGLGEMGPLFLFWL